MRTIKFSALFTVLVFLSVSCVEHSGKYKALLAQRDSLEQVKIALDSNYNQSLVLLNDIESGFSEINHSASEMKVNLIGSEGKVTKKRELIAAQMSAIKQTIEDNKAKIAELQRLASKNGKANALLSETIKRLQAEMVEKTAQIESLKAELEQKNIKISELNTTVESQSKNIAEQQSAIEQQKSKLKAQDADLNTVWYCVAKTKQLKDAKIITTSGLFNSTKKVLDNEFDNSSFTQADLRNLSSVPTNSKRIKILSQHPQNSYNLVTGEDKTITIEITNPSKFWSVSKYLVVQI